MAAPAATMMFRIVALNSQAANALRTAGEEEELLLILLLLLLLTAVTPNGVL